VDNPIKSNDDCKEDDELDVELGNGIQASESLEHRVVSAAPKFPD